MQQTQTAEQLALSLETIRTQIENNKHGESELSRRNVSDSTEDSDVSAPLEWLDELELLITSNDISKEEKFNEILIQVNDQAVNLVSKGKNQEAQAIWERIEKLLETAAGYGIGLDRNLVIVVLYNLAACYQAAWSLDNCSKYTDGVTFNLIESLMNEELNYKSQNPKQISLSQMQNYQSSRLKKQQFLLRIYLQHCAVLSQLSQHENAMELIEKAMKLLRSMLESALDCCQTLKKSMNNKTVDSSKKIGFGLRPSSALVEEISGGYTGMRKNSTPNLLSKEEVHYVQSVLDFAIPFLKEFVAATADPFSLENKERYKDIKKFIFNWKNNPEYNEKFLRKEIQKNATVIEITQTRTLLGVQQPNDWLYNFNIGTVMHMKPMKYSDYTQKRDFVGEVTKESLQEKVIYMSVVLFATATEMRFLEAAAKEEELAENKKVKPATLEGPKKSETIHLQSIGVVCRYTNGSCPYIDHLISSYHKHYSQGLETIPEESFLSISEAKSFYKEGSDSEEQKTLAEITREKTQKQPPKEPLEEVHDVAPKQRVEDSPNQQMIRSSSLKEIEANSSKGKVTTELQESINALLKPKNLPKSGLASSFKKEEKRPLHSQRINAQQRPMPSTKSPKVNENLTQSKEKPLSSQSSKRTAVSQERESNTGDAGFYLKKEFQVSKSSQKLGGGKAKLANKTMPLNVSNHHDSHQFIKDLTAPCNMQQQSLELKTKSQGKKASVYSSRPEGAKTDRSTTDRDNTAEKTSKKTNFPIRNNFQEFFQKLYKSNSRDDLKPSLKMKKETKTIMSPDKPSKASANKTYTYETPTPEIGLTPQKREKTTDNVRQSMIPLHKSQPALYDSPESPGVKQNLLEFSKKDPKVISTTKVVADGGSQQKFSKFSQSPKNVQSSKVVSSLSARVISAAEIAHQLRLMKESQKLENHGSLSSRSNRSQVNITKKR